MLVPGKVQKEFKIDGDFLVSSSRYYKILCVSKEGIYIEDSADNGVDIKVLVKWDKLRG